MELRYKGDFDKVLERFEAWWHCRIIDRPLVTVPAARAGPARRLPEKTHASLRQQRMDVEYAVDRFEASLEGQQFLADSLPRFLPNLGPELTATLFGCELVFSESTSWSKPIAGSCREILDMQLDFENEYWTAIRELTDLSLQRGRGKWLTAITDLHTNGDLPAALRDPQALCLEMADDIDSVRAACDYVTDFFPRIYEDLYDRIAAAGQPSMTWIPAPHAGKMYATSCDLICMISPEMFRTTILPCLIREMRYLDRNIFHLDGPGALRHLDALLELPEMNGVQWIFGAGKGPARKWIDVYRRIQAARKNMQIHCESFDEAVWFTEHLRPEGVWLAVGRSYQRDEIEQFLRRMEGWAAGKRA